VKWPTSSDLETGRRCEDRLAVAAQFDRVSPPGIELDHLRFRLDVDGETWALVDDDIDAIEVRRFEFESHDARGAFLQRHPKPEGRLFGKNAGGVLDEIEIHLMPFLLGDGRRLFDGERATLELTRVLDAPGVTHLRYRVAS